MSIYEIITVAIGWMILTNLFVNINKGQHLLKFIDQSKPIETINFDKDKLIDKVKSLVKYRVILSNENSIVISYKQNFFDSGINIAVKFNNNKAKMIVRRKLFNLRIYKKLEDKIVKDLFS